MAASALLGTQIQDPGSNLNLWGFILNTQLFPLVEEAVASVLTLPLSNGTTTLTNDNFISNQVRRAAFILTAGTGLNASPTVVLPARQKVWDVFNDTGFAVNFTVSGGAGVTVPIGRAGKLVCDGVNLRLFDPVTAAGAATAASAAAAAMSATQAGTSAGQAGTSATNAASSASDALAYRNQGQTYSASALASANAAADSYDAFDDRYLGAKSSAPTLDNDGNTLIVGAIYFDTALGTMRVWSGSAWGGFVPAAADYYTKAQDDAFNATQNNRLTALETKTGLIKPITLTAPAAGATGIGAGGTYTFVVAAFAGDTTGFYSDYGVPVASRRVRVFEPGGSTAVQTFTATGGGPSLAVNFTGSGLATSHTYEFEFSYIDAEGNVASSPRVSATTAAQFKPSVGQSYEGGYLAYEKFGDGGLFDLVVAPKSTEASKTWSFNTNVLYGSLSRLNGPFNTTNVSETNVSGAIGYAKSVTIGGVAGYLAAIDEARAISSKLKPSAATQTAFQAGGSEVYTNTNYWSSTEVDAATAKATNPTTGSDTDAPKTSGTYPVRAIKRLAVTPPYPIGTAMEGGYLAAYFTDLSSGTPVTYMLIVADKATEVTRAWSGTTGNSNLISASSRTNGEANTTAAQSNGGNAGAFNYCITLSSGGKADWKLGAIDEMLAIGRVNSQLPNAQQFIVSTAYWSSTEIDASNAKLIRYDQSQPELSNAKTGTFLVRPIRRVLLPA